MYVYVLHACGRCRLDHLWAYTSFWNTCTSARTCTEFSAKVRWAQLNMHIVDHCCSQLGLQRQIALTNLLNTWVNSVECMMHQRRVYLPASWSVTDHEYTICCVAIVHNWHACSNEKAQLLLCRRFFSNLVWMHTSFLRAVQQHGCTCYFRQKAQCPVYIQDESISAAHAIYTYAAVLQTVIDHDSGTRHIQPVSTGLWIINCFLHNILNICLGAQCKAAWLCPDNHAATIVARQTLADLV